jgi:hypothetical protein
MTVADPLDISPAFTIEDIHKIRERNYEITKDMTTEEKLLYYNTPRTDAEKQIERLRAGQKDAVLSKKRSIVGV